MDADILKLALQSPEFTRLTPDVMGPPLWRSLHNIARSLDGTPEKLEAFRTFVQSLAVLLPCSKCSEHFLQMITSLKTDSPESALKWTIDTHNNVNERLGKPRLTYAQAVQAIMAKAPPPNPWAWSDTATVLVVLAAVFAVVAIIMGILYGGKAKRSS
jgi:hypothetical protein